MVRLIRSVSLWRCLRPPASLAQGFSSLFKPASSFSVTASVTKARSWIRSQRSVSMGHKYGPPPAAKTVSAGILLLGRKNILIRDLCCWVCAVFFFVLGLPAAYAQGTAPTFSHTIGQQAYTLLGHDPAQAVSTTIP